MSVESALFEVNVADGERIMTTAKPNDMGGQITKWSIDTGFMTATDGFEFEFIGETQEQRRGLELAPVDLSLDGCPMLSGRIDITRRGDKGPSIVTCQGRDYISDLVEGNCDPAVSVAAGATLETAILAACSPYGILTVEGPEARQAARTKKQQSAAPKSKKAKRQLPDCRPEPGQGVYDWCNRILARHGLTLQPGSDSTKIVLQAPNYSQSSIGRIIRKDVFWPNYGTVISGIATRDYSSLPTWGLFAGRQGKPTEGTSRTNSSCDVGVIAADVSEEVKNAVVAYMVDGRQPVKSRTISSPRQLYRLLYWQDQNARTQEQIGDSLNRAIAERLKNTLSYEVTLRGVSDPDTGYYWAVDTMVDVDDDVADVHETLWVANRRFSFDGKELRTTLQLLRPNSFVIGDPNA